jgi:transposase
MLLIGVDYHPSFQQIAFFEEETRECGERQLHYSGGEAEKFYRDLQRRGIRVRVGMEATGNSRWFERLLAELGFELSIGDPAEIKAKRVKKQKTDRKGAQLLLRLIREDNFPRIWVPSSENRDLRQLLWHRHRLVQMRTRIMNQLQALAMNEGRRWKTKLWSEQGRAELEKLPLASWAIIDERNSQPSECGTKREMPIRSALQSRSTLARSRAGMSGGEGIGKRYALASLYGSNGRR